MNNTFSIEALKEHKLCIAKQEKWRQKQLNIFYRTGKPIYTMTLENMHLRSKNNSNYYVDQQ